MKSYKLFALLLCVTLLASALTGCGSRTPVTKEVFTQTMENAGFTVMDVTETTQTNGLATGVLIAMNEKDGYQIELWELVDEETGEGVFYNNKNSFEVEHSSKTMSMSVTAGNYNYFAFTADGNFHMIARIANTMLYCEADKAYKDDIVDLAKQLGYK